jgi:putative NADH-flavin reductase
MASKEAKDRGKQAAAVVRQAGKVHDIKRSVVRKAARAARKRYR